MYYNEYFALEFAQMHIEKEGVNEDVNGISRDEERGAGGGKGVRYEKGGREEKAGVIKGGVRGEGERGEQRREAEEKGARGRRAMRGDQGGVERRARTR